VIREKTGDEKKDSMQMIQSRPLNKKGDTEPFKVMPLDEKITNDSPTDLIYSMSNANSKLKSSNNQQFLSNNSIDQSKMLVVSDKKKDTPGVISLNLTSESKDLLLN